MTLSFWLQGGLILHQSQTIYFTDFIEYCKQYLTDCITYFNKENLYLQNEAQSPPLWFH